MKGEPEDRGQLNWESSEDYTGAAAGID